jgi:hypothetical protein
METKRHIGIDLHRNCFTACVRLENGRNYLSDWKLQDLPRFVKKLRDSDEVAVEMTGNRPGAVWRSPAQRWKEDVQSSRSEPRDGCQSGARPRHHFRIRLRSGFAESFLRHSGETGQESRWAAFPDEYQNTPEDGTLCSIVGRHFCSAASC